MPVSGLCYDPVNDNLEGNTDKCIAAEEMNNKADETALDDTEGGEVVPTSDKTEAEDFKYMMPKISLLARRGGGHNETRGCAFSTKSLSQPCSAHVT